MSHLADGLFVSFLKKIIELKIGSQYGRSVFILVHETQRNWFRASSNPNLLRHTNRLYRRIISRSPTNITVMPDGSIRDVRFPEAGREGEKGTSKVGQVLEDEVRLCLLGDETG